MTALVAIQADSLSTPILISPQVARFREGSVVGLPAGKRISLHDLLYALLLPSGNDVALAIAEGVSGTVAAFVARMNDEAQRLGATHTHFTSPHGLYNVEHYSTAHDLALIARVAMQNPTFREIVGTQRWKFSVPGAPVRMLFNHNRLLARYPGADGVKTGYVHQAGLTLVASATRGGWRLIAVLLHSNDLWGDASRLLTYGFAHYRSVEFAWAGEEFTAIDVPGTNRIIPAVVPDNVYGALPPGDDVVSRVVVMPRLEPPLARGAQVGTVQFYDRGRLIDSAPLVTAQAVSSRSGLFRFARWTEQMVSHLVGVVAP